MTRLTLHSMLGLLLRPTAVMILCLTTFLSALPAFSQPRLTCDEIRTSFAPSWTFEINGKAWPSSEPSSGELEYGGEFAREVKNELSFHWAFNHAEVGCVLNVKTVKEQNPAQNIDFNFPAPIAATKPYKVTVKLMEEGQTRPVLFLCSFSDLAGSQTNCSQKEGGFLAAMAHSPDSIIDTPRVSVTACSEDTAGQFESCERRVYADNVYCASKAECTVTNTTGVSVQTTIYVFCQLASSTNKLKCARDREPGTKNAYRDLKENPPPVESTTPRSSTQRGARP